MQNTEHQNDQSYILTRPKLRTSAAVFSSPHSGRAYPDAFVKAASLDSHALRSSEDAYVDEIFATAPTFGAPLLAACAPRAFIDLNRDRSELDPALVTGAPKSVRSPRVSAGLGVIPRVVSDARVIMQGKISLADAEARIAGYHAPYHRMLTELMQESVDLHGMAILFDCHSMPHDALAGSPMINGARPEIVLGDRFGASCDRWVVDAAIDIFAAAGFRVARNAPFAGGHITQTYGRPARGMHALQIEIDRSLYMNEPLIEKKPRFSSFSRQMSDLIAKLSQIGPSRISMAAE